MAKIMWNESEATGLKKLIAGHLSAPYRCADGSLSHTQSWLNAAELCWQNQLDCAPPPRDAIDRVEALRATGAWQQLHEEYNREGLNAEYDRQVRALARYTAMRPWAAK